jgi:hypothetical protein
MAKAYRVTALITCNALFFFLFFQINKKGPLGAISPFAQDPYDAIGSIAIQIALLVGVLTFSRALRLLVDPIQIAKIRFVLRGNLLVLTVILITLLTDTVAIIFHPLPPSQWGDILHIELLAMFGLAFLCAIFLAVVFAHLPETALPGKLTTADAIDDLWTLVQVPITRADRVLPSSLVDWVKGFNSDRLFARVRWMDPCLHSWRFTAILGLCAGAMLILAQLQEGLPPNLFTGLLLAGIFISVELAATLLGFAIFGSYLGLRPTARSR